MFTNFSKGVWSPRAALREPARHRRPLRCVPRCPAARGSGWSTPLPQASGPPRPTVRPSATIGGEMMFLARRSQDVETEALACRRRLVQELGGAVAPGRLACIAPGRLAAQPSVVTRAVGWAQAAIGSHSGAGSPPAGGQLLSSGVARTGEAMAIEGKSSARFQDLSGESAPRRNHQSLAGLQPRAVVTRLPDPCRLFQRRSIGRAHKGGSRVFSSARGHGTCPTTEKEGSVA